MMCRLGVRISCRRTAILGEWKGLETTEVNGALYDLCARRVMQGTLLLNLWFYNFSI